MCHDIPIIFPNIANDLLLGILTKSNESILLESVTVTYVGVIDVGLIRFIAVGVPSEYEVIPVPDGSVMFNVVPEASTDVIPVQLVRSSVPTRLVQPSTASVCKLVKLSNTNKSISDSPIGV